ncbi:flagellar basal body-associated FliL family protein [Meridianimarinicoccus sp. RP-17]|uniref:flagellar basal body-associated FliL family protein n=1 Tax=Meridianimarinicoccus zhengii TaxID=2056810 RepID=UPI000DACEAD3|nr:flagellar basal body-associated FliL family protein [Phycocomes zhengii]
MAESRVQEETPEATGASQRAPLVLATITALALGATGYMAVGNGLVPGLPADRGTMAAGSEGTATPPGVVYLEMEPFMVTIPRTDPVRQLRLELQLEVPMGAEAEVRALSPRLEDTMNTYLRSIDLTDIEDPDTLLRMRMQLLRRLQVAAGDGLIEDLLVTQFLIS